MRYSQSPLLVWQPLRFHICWGRRRAHPRWAESGRYTRWLILLFPRYSGCSQKYLVEMLFPASLTASSPEGNRTSHQVAKLRRQKYQPGIPAVMRSSPNISFFSPASLRVFKTVTMKDRVLGTVSATSSGIGSIAFSLK